MGLAGGGGQTDSCRIADSIKKSRADSTGELRVVPHPVDLGCTPSSTTSSGERPRALRAFSSSTKPTRFTLCSEGSWVIASPLKRMTVPGSSLASTASSTSRHRESCTRWTSSRPSVPPSTTRIPLGSRGSRARRETACIPTPSSDRIRFPSPRTTVDGLDSLIKPGSSPIRSAAKATLPGNSVGVAPGNYCQAGQIQEHICNCQWSLWPWSFAFHS